MTESNPDAGRPLEESPEMAAAADDETTVPQLVTDGGADPDTPAFREAGEVSVETEPDADLIGAAMGGGTPGAGDTRTGAEQPWDPEDLAAAKGRDPTPSNVERARRELDDGGPSAIERTVP
jgi:hypothetical protein